MARRNGGFIGTDGLDAPDPPTAITPTAGDAQLSVAFTAPTDTGTSAITGFVAQVSTDGTAYSAGSGTGTSSPIVVSSLTNGTAYTAKVWAINAYGTSSPSDASGSVTALGDRALFTYYTGGKIYGNTFNISTTSNATDFGNTSVSSVQYAGGFSSHSRAVVAADDGTTSSAINYTTISTTGSWATFGRLFSSATSSFTGASNSITGLIFGGRSNATDEIESLTIATLGNATSFGSLTVSRGMGGACASSTRALFAGGGPDYSDPKNTIDYVTIASSGNAVDFGNLTANTYGLTGTGSSTRGLFAGGNSSSDGSAYLNVIQYVTIASTGNASDFGDLTVARQYFGATSNATRAVFGGGNPPGAFSNVIDYVTIASTGNASDFGDLNAAKQGYVGMSQCHGGLS